MLLKNMKFKLGRIENIAGKEEDAAEKGSDNQNFLLYRF